MNVEQELGIIMRWAPDFTIREDLGEFVTHCPAKGYQTMEDWSLTYDQAIGSAYLLVNERIWNICGEIERRKK